MNTRLLDSVGSRMRAGLGIILLLSFVVGVSASPRPPINWSALTPEDAVPGQLLVGFKQGANMQALGNIHAQIGAQVANTFRVVPAQVINLPRGMTMGQAAAWYADHPEIDYVEPNYIVHPLQTTPNDFFIHDLWGMDRINAREAWDVSTGAPGIVVAVIDTGINYNHEDLKANMWVNPNPDPVMNDIHGATFTGGSGEMTSGDPMDTNGHGTHCAGTIGAVGNNSKGVVGVVWDVKLVGLKFLDPNGSTADAIAAIQYCVERADEIRIISNSWGGGPYSESLRLAIVASKNAGQLFVAAAGNDGRDADTSPMYPAAYDVDNIISVAAINKQGELANFSNYGEETVHIGAPGVGIWSTYVNPPTPNASYASLQGTSMACPHVSGVAAYLLSINPNAPWQELKKAILDGGRPLAALDGKTITGCELDMVGALQNFGGSILLDRRAYQSDAQVTATVVDYSIPFSGNTVEYDASIWIGGGGDARWQVTDLTAIRTGAEAPTFASSPPFTLESQPDLVPYSAVEGDRLRVDYTDPLGRTASASAVIDDTPPVLDWLQVVDITENSVTLEWRADEPSDSRVWFGTALPLSGWNVQEGNGFVESLSTRNGEIGYWHTVTLEGLAPETPYYFAVFSEDYAGNEASLPLDITSSDPEDYAVAITRLRRVIWMEDWELGPRGWTVTNREDVVCWELGHPGFGPMEAYSGSNLWGTVLSGNYPAQADARLTSPFVYLGEAPRLEVTHWNIIEPYFDGGYLEANRGVGWEQIMSFAEHAEDWTNSIVHFPATFDNQNARIRFRLTSDYTVEYAGLYVDDLTLTDLVPFGVYLSRYEVIDDPPGGDGDGHAEPGETFVLELDFFNNQMVDALNVRVDVETETAGVQIQNGPVRTLNLGTVSSAGRVNTGTDLVVTLESWVPVGTRIPFQLTIRSDNLPLLTDYFILTVTESESISGTITDMWDGAPVSGARVVASADGWPELTAVSAANGTYLLHGLRVGVGYEVTAGKAGEYSRSHPVWVIGSQDEVDFTLGQAMAGPDPVALTFALEQGRSGTQTLTLNNANAPYSLDYFFEARIEYDGLHEGWLELSLDDGVVTAAGTLEIDVTATADALNPLLSPYTATLVFDGNDVSDEPVEVPVTLNVTAAPWIEFSDWRINLGGGSAGDGDPFVEPGETLDIVIDLTNLGGAAALDVAGTVSYTGGENVTLAEDRPQWPNILGNTTAASTTHLRIVVGPDVPDGSILPFTLVVEDGAGRVWNLAFEIPVQIRRSILGTVTVCDGGAPVENAAVRVRDGNGALVDTLYTDAAGAYRINGLTASDYTVRVVPPVPYQAPEAQSHTFPAGNGTVTMNFCVAEWGISVDPTSLVVSVPEGVETNVALTVWNSGGTAGSVEFDVRLVSGIITPAGSQSDFMPPPVPWDDLNSDEYARNQLIIRFEDAADPSAMNTVLSRYGLQAVRTFNRVKAMTVNVSGNLSLQRTAEMIADDPMVRYVEPNYYLETFRTPNDFYFSDQYGLHNIRQDTPGGRGPGTLGADINVTSVWTRTTGSRDVIVGIIDTGVESDHPDLAANCVPGYDYGARDDDPRPDYGGDLRRVLGVQHGTHVAGIVGAVGNNNEGVSGVAWEVGIMPLKIATNVIFQTPIGVFEEMRLVLDAAIASLEHCIVHDVPISNHSYGGSRFSGIFYEMFLDAVDAGHLAVAAAGNNLRSDNDRLPMYPASYNVPNIISVAAVDQHGELAYFSNYGSNTVHMAAPGVDILSPWTHKVGEHGRYHAYEISSGTSMAAPYVAGAAALLKSIVPAATGDMLRRALLEGTRSDATISRYVSHGYLDVEGALAVLQSPWISVSPVVLNVPASGQAVATVHLNVGTHLVAGTYEAVVRVQQGHNTIEVPVTLQVETAPSPLVHQVEVRDEESGDGDGYAEPGETVDLRVFLKNEGSALMMGATGTLSTVVADVTILNNSAVWGGMASGDVLAPENDFRVHFGNTVSGIVPFSLTLQDHANRTWVRTFEIMVAQQHSIQGRITDTRTGAGLPSVRVEYWGQDVGSVATDGDGFYRIDGLASGAYRVRALPSTHEIPEPLAFTLVGDQTAADFSVRAAVAQFANTVSLSAPVGQVVQKEWTIENTSNDAFEFRLVEMPRRKVAVISDEEQLSGVGDVLRDMGFVVTEYPNNVYYHFIEPPSIFDGEYRGYYTSFENILTQYDVVMADLTGYGSSGRRLSTREYNALDGFLNRGGTVWLTGPNPVTQPDSRNMRTLIGSDSLDRSDEVNTSVVISNVPSRSDFISLDPGEHISRTLHSLDLATPSESTAVDVMLTSGESVKVMRRLYASGGEVVYWGGNRDGGDWETPGVLQDFFRNILADKYWQNVPWLEVTPSTASVEPGAQVTVTVEAFAHGLNKGAYHATLVMLGNHAGSPVRSSQVVLQVEELAVRVKASEGIMDWMDNPLSGNGSPGSSIFQVIYSPEGVRHEPSLDGEPGGSDMLLTMLPSELSFGRVGVGYETTPDTGRLSQMVALRAMMNPGAMIYIRAWDAATFSSSVAYGDSALMPVQVVANEVIDFGTWVVDQVLGYPGPNPRDTNGDGVPDGWYITFGMDPRLPVGPLDSTATWQQQVGSFGTGTAQFNQPRDLVYTDHFIFVLDHLNHRITVWRRDSMTAVATYGGQGTANLKFNKPRGMGRHPSQNLIAVADTENNRIQVLRFDPDTGVLTHEHTFGTAGSGDGQFNKPADVAIDPLGRYLVADTSNHRIQIFNANRQFVNKVGIYGVQNGRFSSPAGITSDPNGIIYVADSGNHRIQGFNGSGTWLWTLGSSGTTNGRFQNPNGLQVDVMGRLWVADTSNHRIQVFNAQRDFVFTFGSHGEDRGQMRFPYAVQCVASTGRAWVADSYNHRLQSFDVVIDSDGNGIDDAWEWHHFGMVGIDPTADPDGDGLSNLAEYRIGSDPNSADTSGKGWGDAMEVAYGSDPNDPDDHPFIPLSIFSAESVMPLIVEWPMYSGSVYQVQYSTNLLDGGEWWPIPGSTFTSGVNGVVGYTNAFDVDSPLMFYRPVLLEDN